MNNYAWQEYGDRVKLAAQLADDVAAQLNNCIDETGRAVVAFSGGSTPRLMFQELHSRDVDWSRVIVTLVDERWVNAEHELSNQSFLKRHLLEGLPRQPQFVALYAPAKDIASSLATVLNNYCTVTQSDPAEPARFDVAILGMGGDGHTASFFPDADNIADLVDPRNQRALLTCESPSTQVQRITWSLPILLNAKMLALHFTGEDKRKVFESAVAGEISTELPIRAVIHQPATTLDVYYSE